MKHNNSSSSNNDDDNNNNNMMMMMIQQKYCKQKKIANADYVTNLRRQQTTLCQRAQYWKKNNTSSDMLECALDCTSTYVRNWG
jgi:Holliday junction resolvase-like predicted endonuclease